jgi:hypothetical protein
MVAQTIGQSKLLSKQIKHEDTHAVAVTTIDASRIKIVAQKSGAKQSTDQVQQIIKLNIFIHDLFYIKVLTNFILG